MASYPTVTATSTRDVAAVDTGTRRSWRRAVAASWLLALPLLFLGYGLAGWVRGWALGADSSVYRAGAVLLLHGHSPYVVSDLGYLHLSFTYPPAAALLFTPLALLPAQLAWAVMASASVLALALVIRVAVAAVPYWRFPAAWSAPLLTVAMLCLVPVWRTWLQATWRGAGRARWAGAGAVIATIAVFTSTYSVPIGEQRHRTLNSFLFFLLSNPYVLTAIAIALALGAAEIRRRMTPTCRRGAR